MKMNVDEERWNRKEESDLIPTVRSWKVHCEVAGIVSASWYELLPQYEAEEGS